MEWALSASLNSIKVSGNTVISYEVTTALFFFPLPVSCFSPQLQLYKSYLSVLWKMLKLWCGERNKLWCPLCLITAMSSQLPIGHVKGLSLPSRALENPFQSIKMSVSFFRAELFLSIGINWFSTETIPLTFLSNSDRSQPPALCLQLLWVFLLSPHTHALIRSPSGLDLSYSPFHCN